MVHRVVANNFFHKPNSTNTVNLFYSSSVFFITLYLAIALQINKQQHDASSVSANDWSLTLASMAIITELVRMLLNPHKTRNSLNRLALLASASIVQAQPTSSSSLPQIPMDALLTGSLNFDGPYPEVTDFGHAIKYAVHNGSTQRMISATTGANNAGGVYLIPTNFLAGQRLTSNTYGLNDQKSDIWAKLFIGERPGDRIGTALAVLPNRDINATVSHVFSSTTFANGAGIAYAIRNNSYSLSAWPLNSTKTFTYHAVTKYMGSANAGIGQALGFAGYVNDSLYGDLLIGSLRKTRIELIYTAPGNNTIYLDKLNPNQKVVFQGDEEFPIGGSIATSVDVDPNASLDYAFGASFANNSAKAGKVFTFQVPKTLTSVYDLNNVSSEISATIIGDLPTFGARVKFIADFDRNNRLDFFVGSPNADNGAGRTYLFFTGTFSGKVNVSSLPITSMVTIFGEQSHDLSGTDFSHAGDQNSDGKPDFFITAPGANKSGCVYFIYGGNFTSNIYLGNLTYSQGVKICADPYHHSFGSQIDFAASPSRATQGFMIRAAHLWIDSKTRAEYETGMVYSYSMDTLANAMLALPSPTSSISEPDLGNLSLAAVGMYIGIACGSLSCCALFIFCCMTIARNDSDKRKSQLSSDFFSDTKRASQQASTRNSSMRVAPEITQVNTSGVHNAVDIAVPVVIIVVEQQPKTIDPLPSQNTLRASAPQMTNPMRLPTQPSVRNSEIMTDDLQSRPPAMNPEYASTTGVLPSTESDYSEFVATDSGFYSVK